MTARRISRLVLRNCRMILTSTQFEKAGDVVTSTANTSKLIEKTKYIRKHVVFKGTFTVSFPGSDEPEEAGVEGEVFPRRSTYKINDSKFSVTATADLAQYYCVLPGYISDELTQTDIVILAGQSHTVAQGTVAFVFGNNYQINSNTNNENQVVACENSSAVITALDNCKIVEFVVIG